MCVLAIAWRMHPRWRLVVAANRDEYHARPAERLRRWADADILAGRDVQAGGTWLAVSKGGRFAAVTNLRGFGGPDASLRSRGALVRELVAGSVPLAEALGAFNPFNAVAIGEAGAWFLSNHPEAQRLPLPPGLHAMSNGPLDPPWRKTMRLGRSIADWLADDRHDPEALFAGLRDTSPPSGAADDPAPIFVADPVYGTRCSTIVLVDADGAGRIVERRFDPAGAATGETELRFGTGC